MSTFDFSNAQNEAIDFYTGCCNVIASAGSGKTSVLVHRIYNLILNHRVSPSRILAITFNRKAKENMVNRLKELLPDYYTLVNIETFHSFGFSIARMFGFEGYKVLSNDWEKIQILEDIYKRKLREYSSDKAEIAGCINYISLQKNHMVSPNRKSSDKRDRAYFYYEEYKRDHMLMDFDDMLTRACEILQKNPKTVDYCQKHYQFILVDEVQDTNAAQYELIRLIVQNNPNLFLVGDMLQNIYEWRSSSNKYILEFDESWKDFNPKTINLNCNYRSSQDIVEYANKFAKTINESKHKHYVESYANKPKFKTPEYTRYNNEFIEAENIAGKINELIKTTGYNYKDFAILTRTNAQLGNYETILSKKAIPYHIVDGISFIERKEIKIVLSYLRLASDLSDNEAFVYIYNKPNRYLSRKFYDEVKATSQKESLPMFFAMSKVGKKNRQFSRGVEDLYNIINSLKSKSFCTVRDKIEYIRFKSNLDSFVLGEMSDDDNNSRSKIDNLDMLCNISADFISTEDFVSFMSKLSNENDEDGNSVKLMTIHKSKGLEFPVVFIPSVNEKLLPHHRNKNICEERRLMYVAITRPEKELYISSTEQYNRQESKPSIFITELFG